MQANILRVLLAILLAALALPGSPALAELPPRPNGPILDQAEIIPAAEEASLDARLRAYNRDTGRALIVATVGSLEGMAVERYAQELARAWDIGGKESQEGVLFLIAPTERKIRIHAAVGAQGRLTDGFLGRTIRGEIAPRFKANDYAGGINAGVEAVIAQMNRDEVDAQAVAEAADAAAASRQSGGASVGNVVFWIILIVFLTMMFSRRRRGARHSGIDPGIVLWGVSEVLHHASRSGGGGGFDFGGGGSSDSGFGGFGGGGSGFDGGGASGDW